MTIAAFCFLIAYAISGNITVACISAAGGIAIYWTLQFIAYDLARGKSDR